MNGGFVVTSVGGPVRTARGQHRRRAVGGDGAGSVTDFVESCL